LRRYEGMKILFDQGVPAPLHRALTDHSVATAYEMGWTQLGNGALLRAAESQFDVFITTDRNIRYQQNLAGYRLAILILPTTNWPEIRVHQARVVAVANKLRPGEVVELNFA
jgi:predicted nuclease of predicted toxin-antitoxin system